MRISKKIIAIVLSFLMAVSMMPFTAFAEDLPTATVTKLSASSLKNRPTTAGETISLDVGYQFKTQHTADDAAAWENDPSSAPSYIYYDADYVIKSDTDLEAGAVTIAGQSNHFDATNWVAITPSEAITANTEYRLLKGLLDENYQFSYKDIVELVGTFKCGARMNKDSAKGANLTVELRLYKTEYDADEGKYVETGSYDTITDFEYELQEVIVNTDGSRIPNSELTYTWTNAAGTKTTYYNTAFSGTTLSSSGTYKLYKDASVSTRIAPGIYASNVVLDLNGHNITSAANDYVFWLTRAGKAASHNTYDIINTAENTLSTITCTGNADGVQIKASYIDFTLGENVKLVTKGTSAWIGETNNNCSITIDGEVEATDDFALYVHGNDAGPNTVTVNGTAKGDSAGIYGAGVADYIINGNVSGDTGIYLAQGNLTVNDGAVVEGTGTQAAYKFNGSGFYPTGDGIVIDNKYATAPSASIEGGTVTSTNAAPVASYVKQDDATQTADKERVSEVVPATSTAVFNKELDDSLVEEGFVTEYDAEEDGYVVTRESIKPTATVADLDVSTLKNLDYYNKNTGAADTGLSLDVGYEFTPNVTPAQAGKYATYFADFVISADNDVPAGAITIAGNYGSYGWHAITNTEAISAGTQVRLLATFLGEDAMTYADVYDIVQDFKCGIKLNDASIAGTNVTVDLRLFETTNTGTAAEPVYEEVVGGESFSAEDVVYELQPAAEDFATLSVGSKIALNFHIAAAAHNADKVVVSAVNNTKEDNTKYDTTYTDVANVEDYVVSVGLAPAQIKETIHVAIYSGSTVVAEYDYSVYDYCKDIIADADYPVTVKNLVKAFVNYAAAAQKAVEWNQTGALAVADSELYTDVTQATPVFNASASAITGATINSASVICLNETSVRFYYDGTIDSATVSGIEGAQVVIYDDAIDVTGIPANKIGTPFTLTINGTSITYSVDSWNAVALRYFDSTNANYGLAQALANYGAAANAYFG